MWVEERDILNRLEEINRSLNCDGPWSSLSQLQKELWQELENIILQDDLMWAQKARCEWFNLGDQNSKYFHRRANSRRKVNSIEALKDENEKWLFEAEEI